MSARPHRQRKRTRAGQVLAPVHSWTVIPADLWNTVVAPLQSVIAGHATLPSCPHLDGLMDIRDLGDDDLAVWSPSVTPLLSCAECFDVVTQQHLRLFAQGQDPGAACDACGRCAPGMQTYTRQADGLLVIGAFCGICVASSTGATA